MNDVSVAMKPRFNADSALNILALAGSLRSASCNRRLLHAAAACAPAGMRVRVYEDLDSIPLFSEDFEQATAYGPESVRALRERVAHADGLLIATPEYNQSVPGVLKNAIDWLSRPGPDEVLVAKPVAVIGASIGPWGTRLAQSHLRHVLYACEARVMPQPSLFVAGAGERFDAQGNLADAPLRERLQALLAAFGDWIAMTGSRIRRSA